jgi:hypothetical protein
MNVFVITSPTSEGQVAKTLAEMVSMLGESELPMQTPTLAGSGKDQTMATAMTSVRHEEQVERQQKFSPIKAKPEVISVLQGYLLALEAGCTIQDDAGGFYKIKANESDRFTWSSLEKMSSTFRDRIVIHHIGLDTDGKIFVRISLK